MVEKESGEKVKREVGETGVRSRVRKQLMKIERKSSS